MYGNYVAKTLSELKVKLSFIIDPEYDAKVYKAQTLIRMIIYEPLRRRILRQNLRF